MENSTTSGSVTRAVSYYTLAVPQNRALDMKVLDAMLITPAAILLRPWLPFGDQHVNLCFDGVQEAKTFLGLRIYDAQSRRQRA